MSNADSFPPNPDLILLIGVGGVTRCEPTGPTRRQEALIKQLTDGVPMEIRECVGWHVWRPKDGPDLSSAAGDDLAVGVQPAPGLAGHEDAVAQGESYHWVKEDVGHGSAFAGPGDEGHAGRSVPDAEAANVEGVDEARRHEGRWGQPDHVLLPQGEVGHGVGWGFRFHLVAFLGFARVVLARSGKSIRKLFQKDAA